ncbi:MAG: hypothetical protein FJX75_09505 [Armatimonadetes bacterium]|nr:hypothetical protein [Armatimonadota bacterium]
MRSTAGVVGVVTVMALLPLGCRQSLGGESAGGNSPPAPAATGSGVAGGRVIFDDHFDRPALPPGWQVRSPGDAGSYSLTANPGHLRYVVDAYHTAFEAGPAAPGQEDYRKSLHLVRPFTGDNWILTTRVIYSPRPGDPTNNRNMKIMVRTLVPGRREQVEVNRSVGIFDPSLGCSNELILAIADASRAFFFPNPPHALPVESWSIHIERDGDHFAIAASRDEDDSAPEYRLEHTCQPDVFGNEQEIIVQADGWYGSNEPPGYMDFAFVTVVERPLPAVVTITPDRLRLGGGGKRVVAYVELPPGEPLEDVDHATVLLQAKGRPGLAARPVDAVVADYDADGTPHLAVTFDRHDVEALLALGSVELRLAGQVLGRRFEGNHTVRVLPPSVR